MPTILSHIDIYHPAIESLPYAAEYTVVSYTLTESDIRAVLATGEIIDIPIIEMADYLDWSLSDVVGAYASDDDDISCHAELGSWIGYVKDNLFVEES